MDGIWWTELYNHFGVKGLMLPQRLADIALDSAASDSASDSDEIERLFRQNTYLQNKKHMLTCQRWDWLL